MATAGASAATNRVNMVRLGHLGYGAHRDDFTILDHLGRRQLVETVAELVAKDQAPMVVGVHGDWGSGKTSVLRAMRFHLTGQNPNGEKVDDLLSGQYREHVVTVWFESWRYQNEPAPVVALLQEMRRELSNWDKTKAQVAKLGMVAFESVLDSMDKAAKLIGLESIPFSPKDIRASGEKYERDRQDQVLPTDSIQEFLRQAIAALLPEKQPRGPQPRVVVFIDDLDRCGAESAYRLLEGLKIYLQLSNCVFVLGMNQQIVIEAIAERLKKDDNDKTVLLRAEAYLEKLCGNIWRLPLPADPVGYFVSLVDDAAAQAAITSARKGDPVRGWSPCPPFLPPNPRRLRALANMFNRLRKAADSLTDKYTTDLDLRLLVVAYLYQFHSDLFQRWHYDSNFLLRIRAWLESTAPPPTPPAPDPQPHFTRLILPTQVKVTGGASPTPGPTSVESRFPDPSAPGIFWIAPLLQTTLQQATPDEFAALLTLPA